MPSPQDTQTSDTPRALASPAHIPPLDSPASAPPAPAYQPPNGPQSTPPPPPAVPTAPLVSGSPSGAPGPNRPTPRSRLGAIASDAQRIAIAVISGLLLLLLLTRPFLAGHLRPVKALAFSLAALCAVLNHWKKPHEKQDGTLGTHWKTILLLMIVAGFVGAAAVWIEEGNKKQASARQQDNTNRQMTNLLQVLSTLSKQQIQITSIIRNLQTQADLSRRSLAYFERLLAPLRNLTITVECSLTPQTPQGADLLQRLHRALEATERSYREQVGSPIRPPTTNEIQSLNVMGIVNSPFPGVKDPLACYYSLTTTDSTYTVTSPMLQTLLSSTYQPPSTSLAELLRLLTTPSIELYIFTADKDPSNCRFSEPDLHAPSSTLLKSRLDYNFQENHLTCTFTTSVSPTNLHHTPQLSALPDLPSAYVRMRFDNTQTRNPLELTAVTLQFDGLTARAEQVTRLPLASPSSSFQYAVDTNNAERMESIRWINSDNATCDPYDIGIYSARLPTANGLALDATFLRPPISLPPPHAPATQTLPLSPSGVHIK